MNHNTSLLLYTAVAVAGLVIGVSRFKLNSFLALILASLFVGLCSGLKLLDIAKGFQEGVGTTLGFIAVVVGLGTMLGKMLAESGGAEVVANTFLRWSGRDRLHWAFTVVAFIVGLPVFFGVGLVLLVPILFSLARDTRTPLLWLGLPLVAGLAAAHGLVPPHPGPVAALGKLQADMGKTIFYAILIGFPAAMIAGPLLVKWTAGNIVVEPGGIGDALATPQPSRRSPGFLLTLFTILLPVILMMMTTLADLRLAATSPLRQWIDLLGTPLVSLLLAVLFSFYSFGARCGFDRRQIQKFMDACVAPAASIILVVGAGGGFSRILVLSGVDGAIAELTRGMAISPLVLGWMVTALIRMAVGSATVAITLAASILSPVADASPGIDRELLVIALGAGSSFGSHVNDGGFWMVKEYFNLTVPQTLRTWSVVVTLFSIVSLALTLLAEAIVR